MDDFIWEYEAIREEKKQKENEKLKKEKQKKIKIIKKKKRRKKIKRYFFFGVILAIFLIIINYPFLLIKNIKIKGEENLTKQEVINKLNYQNSESIVTLYFKKFRLEFYDSSIEKADVSYNFQSGNVIVNVKEVKPLSHDLDNNIYISSKGEIKKTNQKFYSPIIKIKKEETILLINQELKNIPYKVIAQIKEISYSNEKENILILKMYDGNNIYIYPEQIGAKMKYYLEMKKILDANKKEPGNIYLYIGDYYEEKNN